MVNTLRRFSQPLMIIFTVVIIISFAWWTPSWYASSGKDAPVAIIRGKPVKMEEWQRAVRMMKIHANLQGEYARLLDPATMFGKISNNGIENSLLFPGEAAALGVGATQEEIERKLISMPAFAAEGKFDARAFEAFVQRVLNPEGFSKTQIEQFLADEVRVGKIARLLASTMPAMPSEIRERFISERQTTEASYVAFKAADFRAAQKVTEDEIKKRYEEKKDMLKSPEKRKVRFAAFTLPPSADDKPPEGVKKNEELGKLANAAYELALALQKPGANFDDAAKQAGAKLGETAEHFTRDAVPKEFEGSKDALKATKAAFDLTKEKPHSTHILLENGAYVLALADIKAPEQMPLESVRKQIEDELLGEKADDAMRDKAKDTRAKLAEARKGGKSFSEAAQSLGLNAVAFPAFSMMKRVPPGTEHTEAVVRASTRLAPGDISEVIPGAGAALIVHVDQRPAVDEKGMEEAKALISREIQEERQMEAFQAWLADRRQAADIKVPKERE